MIHMRGHPLDHDEWRQTGLAGWSFADVLPISAGRKGIIAAATFKAATGR